MTALIIVALIALVLACLWLAFEGLTAPEGYEDEDGFHYGEPREWRD